MKIKQRQLTKVIIIILFLGLLSGLRFVWNDHFGNKYSQPEIISGELDLRNTELLYNRTINLSGEWNFYPYELLKEQPVLQDGKTSQTIMVPGNWSTPLNKEKDKPYGYGTYHLRIFVDAGEDETYSIRIPSARSASALYINGILHGNSGTVASNKKDFYARNVPYTSSSIRVDKSGVIDVFLQVANFVDPRSSGLVRNMKFGYETDIAAETNLSTLLQTVVSVVFLIHAIFAIIAYFFGV